jgi:ubiquinone/menaquinone biosynthesis C-methylase UbiE
MRGYAVLVSARDPASARRDVARFDQWAEGYDRSFLHPLFFSRVHRALTGALGRVEGGRVLDVGCGTGTLALALAQHGALVVGVDPAPRMVARAMAKRRGAPASFLVAPAESLPFPDASFDGATASLTVHHWRDPGRGFGELARVLRPGARLAIAEMDLPRPVRWFLRFAGGSHAGWSRRELADLLHGSGFSRVRALSRGPFRSGIAIVVAEL